MKHVTACLFLLASLVIKAESAVINYLLNGSFEYGTEDSDPIHLATNPPSGWFYLDRFRNGNSESESNRTAGEINQDPTPFGERFLRFGGGSGDPGNGLYQNFLGYADTTYEVYIYAKKFSLGWDEPVGVVLEIWDADPSSIAPIIGTQTDGLTRVFGEWRKVSLNFSPLETNTNSIKGYPFSIIRVSNR